MAGKKLNHCFLIVMGIAMALGANEEVGCTSRGTDQIVETAHIAIGLF